MHPPFAPWSSSPADPRTGAHPSLSALLQERTAPDADRRHREIVQLFVTARGHLDHVVATLETDGSVTSPEQQPGSKHALSDLIAAAISSLDLAFECWCEGVDGEST